MVEETPWGPAEPAPEERGRAGRGEAIAGVVLVCALVLVALFQWAGPQAQADHYRAGGQAAAAADWDRAAGEFAAAGAYSDAPARAATARRNGETRTQQYRRAQDAAAQADWVGVLQALQILAPLAPHYRDADALAGRALRAAATDALTGVVALRLAASPPGLYRFGAAGWGYLPDSDATSRVRATCPDGDVFYDGPAGQGAQPVLAPDGRELLRAGGGPELPIRLLISPDTGLLECGPIGLWALRPLGAVGSGLHRPGIALDVGFVPFFGRPDARPALPGPNWFVVGVAVASGRLLLLDGTDSVAPDWQITLVAADAAGPGFRRLLQTAGQLDWAQISPDGRYALVGVVALPIGTTALEESVVLLDLTGAAPAATLATLPYAGPDPEPGSAARFVQAPPRANQILLAGLVSGRVLLSLIDPAHPAAPLLESWVGDASAAPWPGPFPGPAGSLLLAGPAQTAGRRYLVAIGPDGAHQQYALDGGDAALLVRAGYLLEFGLAPALRGEMRLVLRSRPWPPSGATPAPAHDLFSARYADPATGTVGYVLAPNWLVYTDPAGRLRGRSYDGTLDVALPWDVTGFAQDGAADGP